MSHDSRLGRDEKVKGPAQRTGANLGHLASDEQGEGLEPQGAQRNTGETVGRGTALSKRMQCATLWCMRTEVYSWRLSGELKSDLEREARLRQAPVSSVLEAAVRDWLKKDDADASEDEAQRRLHTAAANCFGALASGNSRRAETAREELRKRLGRRYAR